MIVKYKANNDELFYDYLNSICVGSDSNFRIANGLRMIYNYYETNPTSNVRIGFIRSQNLYFICLYYRGKNYSDANNMFYYLIAKYNKEFPHLTENAGFINPVTKKMYIVLKCYKKRKV